jgi:hypothetical protein
MTPDVPAPVVDPNLANEQAAAAADQTAQLQDRLGMDTSSVMARYGSRMALAGASTATAGTVTPTVKPPALAMNVPIVPPTVTLK